MLKQFLNWLLPEDPSDRAGYGPFRLPERCEWMQRAAGLHDQAFRGAEVSTRRLSEEDWDLFYRWVLEAKSCDDPIDRCRRAKDICIYWPVARAFGRYLWDGK